MHRVRVGAIGLACVFLLVMLATALLRMAGTADAFTDNGTELAANAAETPSEPLAELGLAPGNPTPEHAAAPAPAR